MSSFAILVAATVSSVVSTPETTESVESSNCIVYSYTHLEVEKLLGKSTGKERFPEGLVSINDETEEFLLKQVPGKESGDGYCWYVSGEYLFGEKNNVRFVFHLVDFEWTYLETKYVIRIRSE